MILVVEDEDDVRRMAERILGAGGYSVLSASGGKEALEICRRAEQPVSLMLTDVIMPKMLGTELVAQVKLMRPDLPVIYMSGYSHEVLAPETLVRQKDVDFIEKPFNAAKLLQNIKRLLVDAQS